MAEGAMPEGKNSADRCHQSRPPKTKQSVCERRLNRLAAGRLEVAAVVVGFRGDVVGGRANLIHGAFRRAADAVHATLYPVAILLISIACRAGQIVGSIGEIVAGFFAAHRGKQKSEADPEAHSDQETLHNSPPMTLMCAA